MNNNGFIIELENRTGYSKEKCLIINEVLGDHFIVGKKNKEKIISSLKQELNISDEEADNIYNISFDILKERIKDKVKHPFRDLDK